MGTSDATRKQRARRVLVRPFLATLALVAAGELWFRAQVPDCGLTPFRVSEVAGLWSELRPGFTTRYKGVDLAINGIGCRGEDLRPRDPGVTRVALVGDSFAFGSGIPLEDTIARRLEDALAERGARAEIVNLGVPGYSALEVAAVVEHKALAIDPDLVLYVFFANDIEAPRRYDEIPQDETIDAMHGFVARSALLEWLRVHVDRIASGLGHPIGARTPEYSRGSYAQGGGARVRAALTRMRDACAGAGVPLLVADYPFLTHTDVNPFRPIDELAAADAAELGVPFVDLLGAFGGERDLTRYQASVFDQHPSGEANARVARFLAPIVAERAGRRAPALGSRPEDSE